MDIRSKGEELVFSRDLISFFLISTFAVVYLEEEDLGIYLVSLPFLPPRVSFPHVFFPLPSIVAGRTHRSHLSLDHARGSG